MKKREEFKQREFKRERSNKLRLKEREIEGRRYQLISSIASLPSKNQILRR
ncbi:hypothetical protein NC652_009404 [Populus alba x Populus x berolinensis]|uniref:Uncharacterized protein n=1 Tax=Populus alba x Populus x berolinensis TaxID=444605 RepID=A0AAD6RA39_9ROSI|nr:hypothetical protein NC652_009404 [Populus alba x Populus x berolinensis]KAJ7004540.1 hypothetical protein NC653_009399 [Populus alba x Populus x berolinensis]